jgi:hypothetical protein
VAKSVKLVWTDEMQTAFDKMRLLIAADARAAYPDHNKRFDIYTDSSDYQLGACIVQEGRQVAYFSRKLSKALHNYITMEKEMLSIVVEKFRSMLLGAEIHVHTDHKNLTFNSDIKTQRVLRWRTKTEEFLPYLHYIKGEKNVLADNLSRLHRLPIPATLAKGKKLVEPQRLLTTKAIAMTKPSFWNNSSLVCTIVLFGNVLSATSTSLKLRLLRRIP